MSTRVLLLVLPWTVTPRLMDVIVCFLVTWLEMKGLCMEFVSMDILAKFIGLIKYDTCAHLLQDVQYVVTVSMIAL